MRPGGRAPQTGSARRGGCGLRGRNNGGHDHARRDDARRGATGERLEAGQGTRPDEAGRPTWCAAVPARTYSFSPVRMR